MRRLITGSVVLVAPNLCPQVKFMSYVRYPKQTFSTNVKDNTLP